MKQSWTLYYNPKCGSCRKALEILKQRKIEPQIVEYLKTPPTIAELEKIAHKLGTNWPLMVRTKEPIFDQLDLKLNDAAKDKVLKAIAQHPILLQRPIVVCGKTAIVARPPETLIQLCLSA